MYPVHEVSALGWEVCIEHLLLLIISLLPWKLYGPPKEHRTRFTGINEKS